MLVIEARSMRHHRSASIGGSPGCALTEADVRPIGCILPAAACIIYVGLAYLPKSGLGSQGSQVEADEPGLSGPVPRRAPARPGRCSRDGPGLQPELLAAAPWS